LKKIIGSEIDTIKGKGIIEDIYITELNLIMVKVRFGKVWTNYRLSELKEIQRIIFETNE
jgi:hypothetical protein